MNFKEALAHEARAVFCNPAEFGESVTIDGVDIVGVCEWSVQPQGEHLYGNTGDTWGVNCIHAKISVPEGVIPLPEPGQELMINDTLWIVKKALPSIGLLTIHLYRNIA